MQRFESGDHLSDRELKRRAHLQRTEARRAERQQREQDLDALADKARRDGTPYVRVRLASNQLGHGSFDGVLTDGTLTRTHAGTVEFINPPGRVYDYRVVVGVDDGLRRSTNHGRPGTGSIRIDPTATLHAYTESVEVVRRRDGDAISERRLQSEGMGEIRRLAVKALTRTNEGEPVDLAQSAARQLMRGPVSSTLSARDRRARMLDVAQRAYTSSDSGVRSSRTRVVNALSAQGLPSSPSTAKGLVLELRAAGRIDAGREVRPGRPAAR